MAEFFNTLYLGNYFHYIIFALIIWTLIQCARGVVFDDKLVAINQMLGMVVCIVIILMMGFRPVSSIYGDTVNYAAGFQKYVTNKANLSLFTWNKEWLYTFITHFFAKYGGLHGYFLCFAAIYVGSLWLAMRRIFAEYNFVPLLVIMSMFTFWVYGVNGVRNGVGASLFILAMAYADNIPMMVVIALMGAGIHNSVYLMIAAAALAWFVNDSRLYISLWLLCIIVSLLIGTQIQGWMAGYADSISNDNKLTGYLTMTEQQMRSEGLVVSTTFRWDFIAYSALGVGTGFYFLWRRKFEDAYYQWIFNTYIICNAFWILIIRAPYSNRFAQISWFILPLVLIYPFMRERFWVNHERMLAAGILLFYAYGFYFNMLPLLLK
ncbi:MAG: EpsG family protein [Prevotella sp.]|nr:EpsG family protein [Prevotella sp.]